MGDVNEGHFELLLDSLQLNLKVEPQARVERAERLVEQQYRCLQHQRPCQRDALLLTAREFRSPPLAKLADLNHFHHGIDAALCFILADLLVSQSKANVLGDRHVREERVVLEDRVDAALVRRC